MLSCVWHGVCTARTVMPAPILNVELCSGVAVTASHCLPPITGRPANCSSCARVSRAGHAGSAPRVRSACCRRRGRGGWLRVSSARRAVGAPRTGACSGWRSALFRPAPAPSGAASLWPGQHLMRADGRRGLLGRVRRVDDDRVLGLVVDHQVRIVVVGPDPCASISRVPSLLRAALHMGSDVMCMLRLGCFASVSCFHTTHAAMAARSTWRSRYRVDLRDGLLSTLIACI